MTEEANNKDIRGWQFWIDRGGTFTDVVAVAPTGEVLTKKLLSENPRLYEDAAVHAITEFLNEHPDEIQHIKAVKMGTTVGTNALLERKGERVLLITNNGFADALRIGYQNRPDIFALNIVLPDMLYERVVEVSERTTYDGTVLVPLNLQALEADLQNAFNEGFRSCAILLLHAFAFSDHEKRIAELARKIGFTQISCSHEVSPLIKFVSRGDTTLCDAYLSPPLNRYISRVRNGLPRTKLMFMQSNGGLADANDFSGKDSILSGPAGGLIGAIKTAEKAGFGKIIAFDMGGTSTDVSHFNGELEHNFETQIAGVRLRSPILDIHTVAAGGGSLLRFDGARFRVGPESAGASPGPLCYRNGGPLAVTDANVMLGKIQPDCFPKIFGESRNQPLDAASVSSAFSAMSDEIFEKTGIRQSPHEIAQGFINIAVTKMANAIKQVSVQRGHDLNDYALSCFGGAGGQHACLIAESLGISKILIHPLAGVLSALGIGLADVIESRQANLNVELTPAAASNLQQQIEPLIEQCRQTLLQRGLPLSQLHDEIKVLLRYENCDFSLPVDWKDIATMRDHFNTKHLNRYGFIDASRRIVIDSIAVQAVGTSIPPALAGEENRDTTPHVGQQRQFFSNGKLHHAPLYQRRDLSGSELFGPCIIVDDNATTIVEPGWTAAVLRDGSLLLTRQPGVELSDASNRRPDGLEQTALPAVDPVKLELFNSLFMFVAEQMGITLQNTSYSVNIKERLDFSCAIFDSEGNLIANAPHIPVHLGSMGESVKNLLRSKSQEMRPGDVYATNDPYNGGTHLPDITVITPVFDESGNRILFFTASRGHHADIGGITPGSMPPDSTSIEEEGILISNERIVIEGQLLQDRLYRLLRESRYPSRNPEQNISDLKAQIAANARGVAELSKAMRHWGLDTLMFYMARIQDNAEECVRRAISKLSPGSYQCKMDGGSVIKVTVSIDYANRSAVIDFTGTSRQHDGNLNAPLAVTLAAVLYVFRTIVSDDIPLNAGCFRPLTVIVPPGCMLNPNPPAAVVAGNVETSQQVVDALYGALGLMAASQGTMNNFTFGDNRYQYYETICGGSGAGPSYNGVDGVHTHMTNSRLTDPEVLEARYPVIVDAFQIRRGSGGSGLNHGGNGVIRKIRFLQRMTASILSDRRVECPQGLRGGNAALSGKNYVIRSNGNIEHLSGKATSVMEPGDIFVIETPGGGGFGLPLNMTETNQANEQRAQ